MSEDSHIGKVFNGRYRVEDLLGQGGMGRVYVANQIAIDRRVALKVVRSDLLGEGAYVERFYREARMASQLSSPHVVRVYDFGIDDSLGQPFMAMELLEGQDLSERLLERGHLAVDKAVLIASQICRALVDAAKHKLTHRDLKAENIFLLPMAHGEDFVKVMDFGIAKMGGAEEGRQITQSGMIVGTPGYMSPEQIQSLEVDHRSDLYSLGCIIFEMVTGQLPFGGEDALSIIMAHLQEPPRSLVDSLPAGIDVPQSLVTLVQGLLQKRPENRIQHPSKVLDVLLELQQVAVPDTATVMMPELRVHKEPQVSDGSSNLSSEVDSFVGRWSELSTLTEHLVHGQTRIMTLLGLGGTGKTRLSQRFTLLSLDEFAGGAWFCDLSAARDKEGIVGEVASAMGVPLRDRDAVTQLGQAMASRGETLIVLDNFEQLVEHAESTLSAWSTLAPKARFLVTSRRRLGVRGEHVMELQPLSLDEGVQLFMDRARAVKPRLQLDPETEPIIREIVQRLECMSLAIELCAPRLRLLSLPKLLARLSKRFQLLRGHGRGERRQSTLRYAIDWSWDLLEPWQKWALVQCSIFRGGFTLEAAEAVLQFDAWPDAPEAIDALQGLVDHSLVRAELPSDGEPRFSLFESVREYASEKLGQPGEVTDVNDATVTGQSAVAPLWERHARFFAGFWMPEESDAHYLRGETGPLLETRAELANLLAAIEFTEKAQPSTVMVECALAALQVYMMWGPYERGFEVADRAITVPNIEMGERLRCALYKATFSLRCGRPTQAREVASSALGLARECGDVRFVGRALAQLAYMDQLEGDISSSRELYEEALACSRVVGDRRTELTVLNELALLLADTGERERAIKAVESGLAISRQHGFRRFEGWFESRMGHLAPASKREGHSLKALKIVRAYGDAYIESGALNTLADICIGENRGDEALVHAHAAIDLVRGIGARREEGILLAKTGFITLRQGDLATAEDLLQRSIDITLENNAAGFPLGCMGLLRGNQGRFEESHELFDRADQRMRGINLPYYGVCLCQRGEVYVLQGKLAEAQRMQDEARQVLSDLTGAGDGQLRRALGRLTGMLEAP